MRRDILQRPLCAIVGSGQGPSPDGVYSKYDGIACRDRLIEKLKKRIEKREAEQGRPSSKTTALGQHVLKELYKASQAPTRRYEFVRDGHHVFARRICQSVPAESAGASPTDNGEGNLSPQA